MKELLKFLWRQILPLRTQWIPLKSFNRNDFSYILFIRKFIANGKIKFKTVKVSPVKNSTNLIPSNWFYEEKIWQYISRLQAPLEVNPEKINLKELIKKFK